MADKKSVLKSLKDDEIAYVDLVAGSLAIRAMITPFSVRELQISAGKEVTMFFKALSVKLTPR